MRTLLAVVLALTLATPTLAAAPAPGHHAAQLVPVRTRHRRVRHAAKASPFNTSDCANVPWHCGEKRICIDTKRDPACGVTGLDHNGVPCEGICK